MRALWLPDVLRDSGLDVTVEPGWETRGISSWGPIKGVMCHHTATSPLAVGDYPSMRIVRDGRLPPDPSPVPGPLSQLGLGRSGRWYVIASGRANHAGAGSWSGLAGSAESIGIEAEHPGGPHPWDQNQYESYVRGVATLKRHLGPATIVIGHKEWAPTRKTDPSFSMSTFRADVNAILSGVADHSHIPMPSELPREWADETWDVWVQRSGTDDASRGWTFYREDLSWVYTRVIRPLESEVSRQAAEIAALQRAVADLGAGSGEPHTHPIIGSTGIGG